MVNRSGAKQMGTPKKNGFTPVPPSHVHLEPELDRLPLPGGKKVADLTPAELTRALMAAGNPGVSATQGKEQNARAYEKQPRPSASREGRVAESEATSASARSRPFYRARIVRAATESYQSP